MKNEYVQFGMKYSDSFKWYICSPVFSFLTLSFFPHHWWALHCTSLHLDLTDLFCLLTSRARVLRLSLSRLFGSHATGVDTDLLPGLVYLSKFSGQSSCAGIDTSLWKPVYLFFD